MPPESKSSLYVGQKCVDDEFDYTKGAISIRISKKDRQHNGQKKKGQTTIYKTLHIKLKIE